MIEEFKSSKASERISSINGWVQAAPQKYAAEYYSSFTDFVDSLKALVEAANAEVVSLSAASPVDRVALLKARSALNYVAAIYRDCKYSMMHRGRLQELGIHNMYREAYEVGRFAKLSESTPTS